MERKRHLLIIMCLAFGGLLCGVPDAWGQNYKVIFKRFKDYSYYISEVMDIRLKKNRGFEWTSDKFYYQTGKKLTPLCSYWGSWTSVDGNCLILCTDFELALVFQKSFQEKNVAKQQLLEDLNVSSLDSIPQEVKNNMVVYTGEDTPFNADTVFIAQCPLTGKYKEEYALCIGIYAYKYNRPPIVSKCFFTEKGEKNVKKTLARYFKTIYYRENDGWEYDGDKSIKIRYDLYLKTR